MSKLAISVVLVAIVVMVFPSFASAAEGRRDRYSYDRYDDYYDYYDEYDYRHRSTYDRDYYDEYEYSYDRGCRRSRCYNDPFAPGGYFGYITAGFPSRTAYERAMMYSSAYGGCSYRGCY